MTKHDIILKLHGLKPDLQRKYGLTTLALFGSYSREESTLESDIDLLIDFSQINAREFFKCVYEIQEAFQGKKVQVVTKGGIKPQYFKAIEKDLIYA